MIYQRRSAFHAADRDIALMPLETERARKPRFIHETPRERFWGNIGEVAAWLSLFGAVVLVFDAVRGWL